MKFWLVSLLLVAAEAVNNDCSCEDGKCRIEVVAGCIKRRCIAPGECKPLPECSPLNAIIGQEYTCCCTTETCGMYHTLPRCDLTTSTSATSPKVVEKTTTTVMVEDTNPTESQTATTSAAETTTTALIQTSPEIPSDLEEETASEETSTAEPTQSETIQDSLAKIASLENQLVEAVGNIESEEETETEPSDEVPSTTLVPTSSEKSAETTTTAPATTTTTTARTTTTSTTTATTTKQTTTTTTLPPTTTTQRTRPPVQTTTAATTTTTKMTTTTPATTTTRRVPTTTRPIIRLTTLRTTTEAIEELPDDDHEDDSLEVYGRRPAVHEALRPVTTSRPSTTENIEKVDEPMTSSVLSKETGEGRSALIPWWSAVIAGIVFSVIIAYFVTTCIIKKRRTQRPITSNRRVEDKTEKLVDPLLLEKQSDE